VVSLVFIGIDNEMRGDHTMNIFLAGATGVIGRPLLARLLDEGHAVTTITRSEAGAEPLRAQGVKVVVTDVFDRAKVRQAVIEARPEVVVHQLTRIPHSIDPRRVAEQFVQTNRLRTEGTEILMEAALAAGAGQFIAQGITLFYAPDRPGLATEDEPLYLSAPSSFAPVVKALDRLEQIVLNTPGITGAVMRYGHLYGPGTAYAADGSVADLVRQRKMPIVGRGDAVFSFTHVEDAAGATLRAMKQGWRALLTSLMMILRRCMHGCRSMPTCLAHRSPCGFLS
jgi:nucleoside-diphosphate-sugar epimerase